MLHEAVFWVFKQTLEVLTFSSLLVFILTLFYLCWWRRPHPRFPPGPRGIPLLGVIPFLGAVPSRTLKKWSLAKYGPVMSIRLVREEAVSLNTFDAIQQALVKQNASCSDRPWFELTRITGHDGIITARYDATYKIQKHFGLKFLREKGLANKRMEELVSEEGDQFVRFLIKFGGKPVDLHKYFFWLTSNVISKTALGKRHDYGDPEYLELLDALSRIFNDPDDAPYQRIINFFPLMSKLPFFSKAMKNMDRRVNIVLDHMQKSIDEHKENFDPNNIEDFIDAFLYEQKFGKQNESFTELQLRVYCHDLLTAGSETTSTTLCWCFVYLLHYSDYYKRVEMEIEDCVGGSGVPSMSNKEQMPFTCAFIQEVMRIKTLVPLAVAHKTSETIEVMGYVIPKETKIYPNLEGVHIDPVQWPKPQKFNPERHIDRNGNFIASKNIIPFSVGSRFCLGESLARVEIFIFFVKLIQNFRVRTAKPHLPPLDREILSVVVSPRECEVILEAKH